MKKKLVFIATLAVLSYLLAGSSVIAATIRLSQVTGLIGSDTLMVNEPARFTFELEQLTGGDLTGFSNGFRVYTNFSLCSPSQSGYFDAITFDSLTIIPS